MEQLFLERLGQIQKNMARAAIESGRSPQDITLVAATKTNSHEMVRVAIAAGITTCGENRVQELLEKNGQDSFAGAQLHFIGHLQKNKVKDVVGLVAFIQSVHSTELAARIGKQALSLGIVQSILLEVNIGEEESKFGFSPHALQEELSRISCIEGIAVRGIMTIPPKTAEKQVKIDNFLKMRNLFLDISKKTYDNIHMEVLSMGMSDDYYEAILAGSTMVRIGSGLFGAREYN